MKKTQKFYLGVEGGATKSRAILADERRILAQRTGKSLSYHNIGSANIQKNLKDLLSPLLRKVGKRKLSALFGFAGLDTKQDKRTYQKIVRSILPKGSAFDVVNDAHIALEAKCPEEQNRILVISGTGSTVVGQSGNKEAKSIGWDFILGDEGSGYEIGIKVLKSAVQSWDGRIAKTLLEDLVLEQTRCKSIEEFIPKIYRLFRHETEIFKHYIASFAQIVDRGLAQNDWRAQEIKGETHEALLQGVHSVAQRLHIQNEKFCIGIVGSVWNMQGLSEEFQKEIKQQFPRAVFSEKEESGVWGAVLLAKKLK